MAYTLGDFATKASSLLYRSVNPTVTAKAAKIETKKPIHNASTKGSIDVYFTFTGKGTLVVNQLNAKKEAVANAPYVASCAVAASTGVPIHFKVPPGFYYEPEFTEGTASEAVHVLGV